MAYTSVTGLKKDCASCGNNPPKHTLSRKLTECLSVTGAVMLKQMTEPRVW